MSNDMHDSARFIVTTATAMVLVTVLYITTCTLARIEKSYGRDRSLPADRLTDR